MCGDPMMPRAVLETVIYAEDLGQAEVFYRDVLGLEPKVKTEGRQLFYQCGQQMLLIFNPVVTRRPPSPDGRLPVPAHGATGSCHVCFEATGEEISAWKTRLMENGIEIEADFQWPGGGRSIYFRDPAGNCLEFAERRIWGLDEDRGHS